MITDVSGSGFKNDFGSDVGQKDTAVIQEFFEKNETIKKLSYIPIVSFGLAIYLMCQSSSGQSSFFKNANEKDLLINEVAIRSIPITGSIYGLAMQYLFNTEVQKNDQAEQKPFRVEEERQPPVVVEKQKQEESFQQTSSNNFSEADLMYLRFIRNPNYESFCSYIQELNKEATNKI